MKELSFLALVLLLSCNNPSTPPNNSQEGQYDKMAAALCLCWKPIVDLNKKADEFRTANNKEGYLKLLEEAEDIENDLDDCIEKVEETFGEITEEREEVKLMAAMKKLCPTATKVIEEEEAELE